MTRILPTLLLVFLFASAPLPAQEKADDSSTSKINSGLLSSLKFRSIGPALMSGRIGDLAVDPHNPNIWYVGVASGNVWKTTNAGTTFEPIFDNYDSYSIGCVTIDPRNSNTIWVGTGENNGGRHIGIGDGVYVSHDGGKSFKNKGLKASEHVSRILVHPANSNVIFVASQGPLWSPGGQRGLFKSTDGGETWKNVLSKGEYTGVTDVVFDPRNPNTLYAATHQRHRTVWALLNTGPESGIHKSTDGGETWTELKAGLPGGDKGKICLQVSPQKSNVVYAGIELPNRTGGFYRSEDFGNSWTRMSDFVAGATGPHYYQEIFCDPHRFDVIYHADSPLMRSEDGGKTFDNLSKSSKHVDNHAVAFSPTDPNFLLVGCDGGVYKSYDYAKTFQYCANLPVTQFYKVDVDYDYPFYHVAGGTQDNYSQYGPTRTNNIQGIRNSDWIKTIGGDGHDGAIDPEDPNIIYCESQQGNLRRYDRRTGESVDIKPRPGAGEENFRFNWDSPILISPHNHKRLYFGSKHLHRSEDQGDSWTTISPDLSRNNNRLELKIMGRVWGVDAGFDLFAMSQYGNVTSISESPVVENLLYVGTDDGLIQVSEDGGQNWRKIDEVYGVPQYGFVNDIKADRHNPDTVYACWDNHKNGDYKPYLVKSNDRGRTWTSMAGDLPDRHLVWRIEQDHVNPNLFFLATEYGIFVSINAGENWIKLSAGLPTISFRDLAIQKRENDLVGASFGRGFYVLDDYSPLRELTDEMLTESEFHLFPVRKTFWYVPADHLGGAQGFQGDSFFQTPNPEFGATLTYFVRDPVKTKKQLRKEQESKIAQSGGDVPIPSLEELRAEEQEEAPSIYFEIYDQAGERVAKVNANASQGLHRTSWNLRYNGLGGPGGPMVAPGNFQAQAFKRVAGEVTKLGEPQMIEVVSILDEAAAARNQNQAQRVAAQKDMFKHFNLATSTSAKIDRAIEELQSAKSVIAGSPQGTVELLDQTRNLELSFSELNQKLSGDPIKDRLYQEAIPSIRSRLQSTLFGSLGNTYGLTRTQQEQLAIAKDELAEVGASLKALLQSKQDLEKRLNDAGVPLTPGRPIPGIDD